MINLPDVSVPMVRPDGRVSEAWYPILRLWVADTNRKTRPVLFSALPSAPDEGTEALITDSSTATWGAVIAGGGANRVLARWNSTNWTVVGI